MKANKICCWFGKIGDSQTLNYKFNSFCNLLSKYDIEFNISDVTESVIKGDIQKMYPDVEELTPNLFEDFRYDNTSVDDILDKIIRNHSQSNLRSYHFYY